MRFQNLPEIHAGNDAERIQNDVHRRTIREIRHVLHGADLRDDALIAVAARKLVARLHFAQFRDLDLDAADDARFQLVAALAVEYLHVHHATHLAVRQGKRSIFHVARFFAENGAEQPLLGRKL